MAIVTVQQLSSKIFSLQHSRNEHLPYDSTVDKCPEQVQIEEVNLQAQNFSQVAKNEQEVALPMSTGCASENGNLVWKSITPCKSIFYDKFLVLSESLKNVLSEYYFTFYNYSRKG